jgi:hypothetical protein
MTQPSSLRRETFREPWETRWCFKCRRLLPHDAVLLVPEQPSYYGPSWRVECHGCGEDHVHFPGCEPDGPTLQVAGS